MTELVLGTKRLAMPFPAAAAGLVIYSVVVPTLSLLGDRKKRDFLLHGDLASLHCSKGYMQIVGRHRRKS